MEAWYSVPMFGILVPLSRGFHFCYERCIAPRSTDEDTRRRELLLNIILAVLIFVLLSLLAIDLRNSLLPSAEYAYHGVSTIKFVALVLLFVSLYVLARHGFVRPVSYLLVLLLSFSASYASYRYGVGMPSALLFYGLIISIARFLIGFRFALVLTSVFVVFIVDRGFIESHLATLPIWRTDAIQATDSIQYAVIILLTAVVSLLAGSQVEMSLKRARQSERELKEKNESLETIVEERTRQLKQAQAAKMSDLYRFVEFGRLSSGVFHDILNPLSAMTSTVSDLAKSLRSEGPLVQEKIGEAVRASRRMERFMESVKKQIQAHHIDAVFSANNEIEEALTLFEYMALSRHVMLEFIADEHLYVRGNPLKFQQIVTNLVSNALDAYDGLPREGARVVIVSVRASDRTMELCVRDRGCGMDPAIVQSIFDPFFTTKQEHRGIGLGLSTTKHIIEKDFGGSVSVESAIGAGSAFTVSIPRVLITELEPISTHEEEITRQWIDPREEARPLQGP